MRIKRILALPTALALAVISSYSNAEVTLVKEVPVADNALYFNGVKKASTSAALNNADVGPQQYDYMYGRSISPHGDCIKSYKEFVFMTWYRGGKQDRKVMLTRYNTKTGTSATIEFPHRHTGYGNRWWVGETHNTISVGLSPKNESLHMVFDQHSLSSTNPPDGTAANDYFKYYYTKPNSLTVPDEEFTLDLFVKDDYFTGNDAINAYDNPNSETDEYKHITLNGNVNSSTFANLTYPKFFLTNEGDLFLYMRQGRSQNGRFAYIMYDGEKWQSNTKSFNYSQAKSRGNAYDYGVYGQMKYAAGKIRIGFQQRANLTDRYKYQNGFFGAYSDDPTGKTDWKNYKGETLSMPVLNTDLIKISEPGDMVEGNETDRLSMVGGFDWNVTERGDVHFVGKVTDTREGNLSKRHTYVHTYRKAGDTEFTTSTDFAGADELYTSGKNIYIIGIQEGRPYVERAEGGTNDFERIYAPTAGKTFEKGVPYINDGILYYYLLESHGGDNPDARKTVLQIIDLGITGPEGYTLAVNQGETVEVSGTMDIAYGASGQFVYLYNQTADLLCADESFGEVNITGDKKCYVKASDIPPAVAIDQTSMEMYEGYSQIQLTATASASMEGRTIADVKLYLNDALIATADTAPFEWDQLSTPELLNLAAGTHIVKVVATDSEGLAAEHTLDIVVMPAQQPDVSFVTTEFNLLDGYTSIQVTATASTPDGARSIANVMLYMDGEMVGATDAAPYHWNQSTTPSLLNLSVGTHELKVVATDDIGMSAETTLAVTVNQRGQTLDDVAEKDSSGGSTSPWLLLLGGLLAFPRVVKRQSKNA